MTTNLHDRQDAILHHLREVYDVKRTLLRVAGEIVNKYPDQSVALLHAMSVLSTSSNELLRAHTPEKGNQHD